MAPKGIKVRQRHSYATIERIVTEVRARLVPDIPVDQRIPSLALFESLGRYKVPVGDRYIPLSYAVDDLSDDVAGKTHFDRHGNCVVVCLSAATYDGLEQEDERARFTMVHEVGHAVLHPQELIEMTEIPHLGRALLRRDRTHRHCEDSEWQANAFASAFIAPAEGIALIENSPRRSLLGREFGLVHEIHRRFGLSLEASSYRLECYTQRRGELL